MEVSVANQAVRWLNPLHGALIWVCRGWRVGEGYKKVPKNAYIIYVCPTQRPKKWSIFPDELHFIGFSKTVSLSKCPMTLVLKLCTMILF